MSSYEKIVEVQVPGTITALPRTTSGQQCTNTNYFSPVSVTCVQGTCNMPAQMYTGAGFNRICYDRAYGLVQLNGQSHGQCDWFMDAQVIQSVYLGNAASHPICNGVKDTTGAAGVMGTAMNAVSIWYRTASGSAVGDPHLQNVHGEKFDLMKPGNHVLINIPRGVSAENALLRVQARASHLGIACADMYFQELNITGSWAEAKQVGGYHLSVSSSLGEVAGWIALGKVELKVVNGRTDSGLKYLNFYVKHLGRAGFAVGGLLGEDDHTDVTVSPKSCEQRLNLADSATGHGPSGASIAAASFA